MRPIHPGSTEPSSSSTLLIVRWPPARGALHQSGEDDDDDRPTGRVELLQGCDVASPARTEHPQGTAHYHDGERGSDQKRAATAVQGIGDICADSGDPSSRWMRRSSRPHAAAASASARLPAGPASPRVSSSRAPGRRASFQPRDSGPLGRVAGHRQDSPGPHLQQTGYRISFRAGRRSFETRHSGPAKQSHLTSSLREAAALPPRMPQAFR